MSKTCKKSVALMLVLLQLVVLLPGTAVRTSAADTGAAVEATQVVQPNYNPVYFGTVQFGTFNYTAVDGDLDGADYVMPFIYTDDYFAAPSYSEPASAKELPWTALEDKSLATTSMDFTMACFGSNEEATDEADYNTGYDKNGIAFLDACDFESIESNNYEETSNPLTKENKYNKFPSKDSIGATMGSKTIEVWNGTTNERYTLVAIGVRGAGYGAEWASNLTLGPSGEHQGFREAANKVEYMLDDYLDDHGITASDNVKFWVCGYSRSGAVANLVAGDLSRNSKYSVAKENVYGYTFESAAGADKTVDPTGSEFPNIHNILSKMDAVPRVSTELFGNNRYGVDYIVPYHGNTENDPQLNTDYYNLMYSILKTVAQGYGEEDPVVTNAHPDKYPYDRKVDVYELSLTQIVTDTSSLGLKKIADDSGVKNPIVPKVNGQYQIYIDDFLDLFVERFAKSKAWDYGTSQETDNAMTHRQKYVSQGYQESFRTLVGAALGTPGTGLNTLMDKLQGAVGIGLATKIKNITSITEDINALDNGKTTRWSLTHLGRVNCYTDGGENLAEILKYILGNADLFDRATLNQVNACVDQISPILFALFSRDHASYSAQYTGTLLKYALDTILVTHTPELDVSWQMAMDENYVNSYREIVLPGTANVKMYAFRAGFEGELPDADADAVTAQGALVAEVKGGSLQDGCLDMRISATPNADGTVTLRYPGTEDYRFDIEDSADGLQVTDLQPVNGVNAVADYDREANGNIQPGAVLLMDDTVLEARNGTSAQQFNARTDLAVGEDETLCVMARHGTNSLDKTQAENAYSAVKTYSVTFDANQGDGSMAPMKRVVPGAVLTENAFTRDAYDFDGWNTEPDGSGTAYADGAALEGLNSSLTLYAQWKVQTYSVELYFRAPGVADKYATTVENYAATKSMKLTATPTYTTGGKTYYFDHWEFGVDEQTTLQYPYRIVTIRPNRGGEYSAYAVYSETKKTDFTPFVMIIRDEEVGGKLVKTLTYSLPEGYALQENSVGFRVYEGSEEIGSAFSTVLKKDTGTYTVTILNPTDDIRVTGEITYLKDGTPHKITADEKGVVSQ